MTSPSMLMAAQCTKLSSVALSVIINMRFSISVLVLAFALASVAVPVPQEPSNGETGKTGEVEVVDTDACPQAANPVGTIDAKRCIF
ncbi:hypothetical protein B0J11DRAFT_300694 [Dendryphion nanum]|uniref:Uncharacterized protein n=1 Tax=Dendryphion nanum TaxID=256645 RepID=A0A9P9ILW2_9PLEO|nr:hypothetical protein B0J11DRAFT_300694 [Dendryphion nanum]